MFEIGDIVKYAGIIPKYGYPTIMDNLEKGFVYTIYSLDNVWCQLEEDLGKWWYPQECFIMSKFGMKKKYNLK